MENNNQEKKSKKVKLWVTIAFVFVFIGLMFFLFSGKNFDIIKSLFRSDITKEEVQATLSQLGVKAYVTLGILSMLQVVLTFLPAEPVQVMAGISLGLWKGVLVCTIGVIIGNTIIYILYKVYGQKLTNYFKTNAEFDFESASKSNLVALIVFILYFLPAIPYGLICFFAASLGMKYPKYIILTTLGAIPSVFIGVGLGHVAMSSSWIISIVVFVVLLALLMVLFKNKSKVFKKINDFIKSHKNKVKRCNKPLYDTVVFGTKLIYDRKVKIKWSKEVKKIEKPSIVLCTHGSFNDFVYVARILRKERPNFIAARLYFFHNKAGYWMKAGGCIPKSMFTADFDNAKACMKVIAQGGALVMMPEARLSTAGKFEDIQDSTYKFLQKMGVSVYTCVVDGDYFANPKWGNGTRKGGLVEVTLKKLFDKEEIKNLSTDELKDRTEKALYYNDFEWINKHPDVHYKSTSLAEGLQNVLYLCPKCGKYHTITTSGMVITCSACGETFTLNDRYYFTEQNPFNHFGEWYDWQKDVVRKEILSNPDFKLTSKVELRHGSKDGKTFTRHAGEGVCTLDRSGLTYEGTRDGETIQKVFPMNTIYRLLFGAGEDFEIYEGKEIWYFVPEEKRSCVLWYVVSELLNQTL